MATCFVGHREIETQALGPLQQGLKDELLRQIAQGHTEFVCSGMRGFDLLASFVVLQLRKQYPEVVLHLVLPCKGTFAENNRTDQSLLALALQSADTVEYLAEKCDEVREREMIEYLSSRCARCIVYLHDMRGTAHQRVGRMQNAGKEIIPLRVHTI